MRLDKFLKISRIIKRRSVAKEIAGSDLVLINGKKAKPSSDIKIGDKLDLYLNDKHYQYEVLLIRDFASIYECESMYTTLIDEKIDRGS